LPSSCSQNALTLPLNHDQIINDESIAQVEVKRTIPLDVVKLYVVNAHQSKMFHKDNACILNTSQLNQFPKTKPVLTFQSAFNEIMRDANKLLKASNDHHQILDHQERGNISYILELNPFPTFNQVSSTQFADKRPMRLIHCVQIDVNLHQIIILLSGCNQNVFTKFDTLVHVNKKVVSLAQVDVKRAINC
jgi:hypothetical protein